MSILDRLSALFTSHTPEQEVKPLPPTDVPHALGALLVRVAMSDNKYVVQEISQIDRILARFQDIGPIEAAKLRAECERLEAFAPDTPEFARLLCKSTDYEDRLRIVKALWQIVYADGALREIEAHVMDITQAQLGIRQQDCAVAQAEAQAQAAILNTQDLST